MSKTFLDKILAIKRENVERQKRGTELAALKKLAFQRRENSVPHRLHDALSVADRTNIIAEIKRASPSKGEINETIDVAATAEKYEKGSACAISVLTEEDFFHGSLNDLKTVRESVDLPILRKDFTVDEFQIFESAAAGADAILLIVAVLTEENLQNFLRLIQNELGMDALIEVHTSGELDIAKSIGANIIGVNNRDLPSFEVSLDVSRKLIREKPVGALMISESGISTLDDILELRSLGFDGFLVGETLMRTGDPQAVLEAWI